MKTSTKQIQRWITAALLFGLLLPGLQATASQSGATQALLLTPPDALWDAVPVMTPQTAPIAGMPSLTPLLPFFAASASISTHKTAQNARAIAIQQGRFAAQPSRQIPRRPYNDHQPAQMVSAVPQAINSTCVVTTTADSGSGSLRSCLSLATEGLSITFYSSVFPPTMPATITLLSPLPFIITDSLTLDGSDAGVILNGAQLLTGSGLVVRQAHSVTIRGLLDFGQQVTALTNAKAEKYLKKCENALN